MSLCVTELDLTLGKKKILDGVSFTVDSGDLIALLGASGAGKSTTLKVIAGLLIQDSGQVSLDGELLDDLPPYRRGCAVVFQDIRLFPNMNVVDNVGFSLRMQGIPKTECRARAREMLELVHLSGFEKRQVHEISGGQQQRVALARAIAASPRLLLLDEPFSGLDESLRDDMRMLVLNLHRKLKMTTLMVTHDAHEALSMSSRIVYMSDGRVVQDARPDELFNAPATLEAATCFGDCSVLQAEVSQGLLLASGLQLPVRMPDGRVKAVIRNSAVRAIDTDGQDFLVAHCVYHGDCYLVTLDVDGQELLLVSDSPKAPGEPCAVQLDPKGVLAFADPS